MSAEATRYVARSLPLDDASRIEACLMKMSADIVLPAHAGALRMPPYAACQRAARAKSDDVAFIR